MYILIIDDDSEGVEYIATFLQLEGFTVQCTATGREGLALMRDLYPDLVLLDVRLPDVDGWDLCRQIRRFSDVPILKFSAYNKETEHQVEGLNLGADDYLVKPVELDLLKAHIIALLRRASKSAELGKHPFYIDSHLLIDFRDQNIFVGGQRVSLSPLEYQLLLLLVTNIGQAVPTLEIGEHLWPQKDEAYQVHVVHIYVNRLRQIIEPTPKCPCYITTEYGFGYCFSSTS